MFMVMLILNNPDLAHSVLDAWDAAGAPGVTVLSSTGLGRIRARIGLHDDMPLMPSLDDFFQFEENLHRTIIAVIRDRAIVDAIIRDTQSILGDLNRPHSGILVVLPVLEVYGLDRQSE